MDAEKLNQWLTLAANIAVFASIMFLAIEIRQNQVAIEESNRLSRLDARVIEIDQFNDFRNRLAENPQLMRVWIAGQADEELSPVEEEQFRLLCNNVVWISAGSWERSVALDRVEAAAATTAIRAQSVKSSKRFAECWQFMRDILIPYGLSEYVRQVEETLEIDVEQDQ